MMTPHPQPGTGPLPLRRPGAPASRSALVVVVAMLATAPAARAQGQGDGYLFREPVGSFTLRAGFSRANARSDVFSDALQHLTLGRGDFSGLTFGTDLAFRVTPRFDLVLSGDYAGTSAPSEFRHWVDQDDRPIQQTTAFVRVPLTASVRGYLTSRGRSVGRFAWIPSRVAPFVGAGGGLMYYRFEQKGDFVNFETNGVFNADLKSSRFTPTAHVLAGVDYSLSPRFALTSQGRYEWARARMSNPPFEGFNAIDLSGFAATMGFYVRF